MFDLLTISLAPGVPAWLKNIPEKHNIIIRLWTNCFYRLLENLRRSSPTFMIALELLQESIHHADTFYTTLLERNTFKEYCAGWLGALGDLARYCIVIADMIPAHTPHTIFPNHSRDQWAFGRRPSGLPFLSPVP